MQIVDKQRGRPLLGEFVIGPMQVYVECDMRGLGNVGIAIVVGDIAQVLSFFFFPQAADRR